VFRILVLLSFVSLNASADVVVSGHSTFGCATEILQVDPVEMQPSGAVEPPAQCRDFSGEWEGGCHWAVMKCPRVTALGDCIVPTIDEVYLDNVWTKADLAGEPTQGPKHLIQIKQNGCRSLEVSAPEKTMLHGVKVDYTRTYAGNGFEKFRRECESDGRKWRRTYEMTTRHGTEPRWSADGAVAQVTHRYAARDRVTVHLQSGDCAELRACLPCSSNVHGRDGRHPREVRPRPLNLLLMWSVRPPCRCVGGRSGRAGSRCYD
jgi:hypothetical protein